MTDQQRREHARKIIKFYEKKSDEEWEKKWSPMGVMQRNDLSLIDKATYPSVYVATRGANAIAQGIWHVGRRETELAKKIVAKAKGKK